MSIIEAARVDAWLSELDITPLERDERDGVSSWDLRLDGRLRPDIRLTLILDPRSAMLLWVHFAPPLNDSFRVSYRQLLRWNDELPFVKFSVAEDERPVLTAELPIDRVTMDELGLTLVRLLAICDRLLEESAAWLWHGGRMPRGYAERTGRNEALLRRYEALVPELFLP
jgi:hypothetical protein